MSRVPPSTEHCVSIRSTSQLTGNLLARRSRLWFASSRPSNIFVVSVSRSLVHVLIFSDLLLQTCSSVRRSPNNLGLTVPRGTAQLRAGSSGCVRRNPSDGPSRRRVKPALTNIIVGVIPDRRSEMQTSRLLAPYTTGSKVSRTVYINTGLIQFRS